MESQSTLVRRPCGRTAVAVDGAPRRASTLVHDDPLLTTRQAEILELMAEGLSNMAIARRLHVSEKAVVQHCSNIYAALGLHPSAEAHRRVLAVLRHLASREAQPRAAA